MLSQVGCSMSATSRPIVGEPGDASAGDAEEFRVAGGEHGEHRAGDEGGGPAEAVAGRGRSPPPMTIASVPSTTSA